MRSRQSSDNDGEGGMMHWDDSDDEDDEDGRESAGDADLGHAETRRTVHPYINGQLLLVAKRLIE